MNTRTNRLWATQISLAAGWLSAAILLCAKTSAADEPNVSVELLHSRVAAIRAESGAEPLTQLDALDRVAQAHADDMAAHQQLGHVFSAEQTPDARVRSQGLTASLISQNIAAGRNAAAVLRSLTSAANRTNFVNSAFTHVGYGVAVAGRIVYVAQILAAMDGSDDDAVPLAPDTTVPDVVTVPEPAAAPAPAVVQTPAVQGTVSATGAGYWICYGNRWWFYPLPANVQNGQQLVADTSVRGAPPGYDMQRCVDRTQVAVSVPPAPQAYQPTYVQPSYLERRYPRPVYVQPAPVYRESRRPYRAPRRVYVGPGARFQVRIR